MSKDFFKQLRLLDCVSVCLKVTLSYVSLCDRLPVNNFVALRVCMSGSDLTSYFETCFGKKIDICFTIFLFFQKKLLFDTNWAFSPNFGSTFGISDSQIKCTKVLSHARWHISDKFILNKDKIYFCFKNTSYSTSLSLF